jgi:hypothetical protein
MARARPGAAGCRTGSVGRESGSASRGAHAATLFWRIDPKKALRDRATQPADGPPERIGRGTTAFAVADVDGNMIAVTQTLSTWGGTFYVSDGLGFLYNNHLRSGGGGGGAPGRFLPLARSSSTSVPTLVFRNPVGQPSAPRLAVAAAGNAWIPASVYDIILNVIDGGMTAQRAMEAPRFLVGRDPVDGGSRPQIEDRIPRPILEDLMARGHRFQKNRPQGRGSLRLRRGRRPRRGRPTRSGRGRAQTIACRGCRATCGDDLVKVIDEETQVVHPRRSHRCDSRHGLRARARLLTPARSGPMTRLERSGLVIRRSCGSMETFVNASVWSGMRPNDQQQAAQALGAHCAEQGSSGEMTILEDQTRRKIAHWNGTTLLRF